MFAKTMLSSAALVAAVSLSAVAGSVTGVVKFEGKAPTMRPLNIAGDAACAAKHGSNPPMNEALVLGDGQTMANVIVEITGNRPVATTPPPAEPVVLSQEGCKYTPHVFVVRVGQPLKVTNPDAILHNVKGSTNKNKAFNEAMPANLQEIEIHFAEAEEPFPVSCQIHPWMTAYCQVADHPFITVTGKNGAYKIDGLPAGEYEVTAWHEKLGKQTGKITVAEGAAATHDFTFKRE